LLSAPELLELLLDKWRRPGTDVETPAPAPAPLGGSAVHAPEAPFNLAPSPLRLPDEELLEDFALGVNLAEGAPF